jgi:hypothetical protein
MIELNGRCTDGQKEKLTKGCKNKLSVELAE